jgi:hypothetical protein
MAVLLVFIKTERNGILLYGQKTASLPFQRQACLRYDVV